MNKKKRHQTKAWDERHQSTHEKYIYFFSENISMRKSHEFETKKATTTIISRILTAQCIQIKRDACLDKYRSFALKYRN